MNERIRQIIEDPKTKPIACGVGAFVLGFGVGYILGKRSNGPYSSISREPHEDPNQLKLVFDAEQVAQDFENQAKKSEVSKELLEITEGLEAIKARNDKGELDGTETRPEVEEFVADKLKEAMTASSMSVSDDLVITSNVFADNSDDGWDYEEELKSRTPSKPYILHKDEFYADEMDFSQITLTYYAGDDIMADEDETPVYNYKLVTGDLNFGHGSGDPGVVYVRNEKRRAEYEILHDPGLFTVEVMGLEIEDNARVENLKHSDNRKFKME